MMDITLSGSVAVTVSASIVVFGDARTSVEEKKKKEIKKKKKRKHRLTHREHDACQLCGVLLKGFESAG